MARQITRFRLVIDLDPSTLAAETVRAEYAHQKSGAVADDDEDIDLREKTLDITAEVTWGDFAVADKLRDTAVQAAKDYACNAGSYNGGAAYANLYDGESWS